MYSCGSWILTDAIINKPDVFGKSLIQQLAKRISESRSISAILSSSQSNFVPYRTWLENFWSCLIRKSLRTDLLSSNDDDGDDENNRFYQEFKKIPF